MRNSNIVLSILLIIALTAQCNVLNREQPVAQVEDAKLTSAELEIMVTKIGTEEDYLNAVRKYVNDWVDRELLYREALRQNIKLDKFMKAELERVRKSMIVNLFVQTQINDIISVSDSEISEYYDTNPDEFISETNYYKFEAIKATDAEFTKQLEKDLKDGVDIRNIFNAAPDKCQIVSNGLDYLAETHIPPVLVTELEKHKTNKGFFKFLLQDETYFVKINETLPKGEKKPLEMVEREIKQMLIYQKRRKKQDDLISRLRNNENSYQINLIPDKSKERQ